MPGTGKTYLMSEKLWLADRIVIYNTCGSYGFGPRQNPLPGFVFVFTVGEMIERMRIAGRGPVRLCFTPLRAEFPKKELFADVCRLVADFRDVVFAVDEVWNFQSPSWSPEEFNECMLQWRHYGMTLLWTAQRPQKVDATLRGMSTEIYAGRLTTDLDIQAMRECNLPPEAMAMLPKLRDREFIHRMENSEWRVEKS